MGWLKRMIIEDMEPTEYELARRWIPVTERLPDEEQEVLAYWPPEDQQCGRWMSVAWVFEGDKWKDMEMELKSPTHWMPLPAPPTDAK